MPKSHVQLPQDIFRHIFSFALQPDLLNCRLLNHAVGSLATSASFRHIRLEAVSGENDGFMQIAMSPHLRPLVREITCDTWVGPDFEYHCNGDYQVPEQFMKHLPCLRFFANLKALHLRFNEHCGAEEEDYGLSIEETYNFRYRVLNTVFRCLAGTWSAEKQRKLDERLDLDIDIEPQTYEVPDDQVTPGPIHIETLTVSNLADYNDKRLTSSDAFQTVINSPHLTDLKLLIAVETDEAAPENGIYFKQKYEMFQSLPQTWLSPVLAQNLKVLSLFCADYWGWNPKMDFRAVNPIAGSDSGFPNLRVLALGNYIFSHEWQVDWIASLGKKNGRGGLEELYLDDCPIMFHSSHLLPMDTSVTTLGKDVDGVDVTISNNGYPLSETMTNQHTAWDQEEADYSLRWHKILPRWTERMTALKVFKMGRGSWHWAPPETREAMKSAYPDDGKGELTEHRITGNNFRYYDSPSPPKDDARKYWPTPLPDIKYLNGTGISEHTNFLLQYITFDIGIGPSQWCEIERDGYDTGGGEHRVEDGARELDHAALKALEEVIKTRHTTSGN